MQAEDFNVGKQFINIVTKEVVEVMNFGDGNVFVNINRANVVPSSWIDDDLYIFKYRCKKCKGVNLISYDSDNVVYADNKPVCTFREYVCEDCGFISQNINDFISQI